MPNEWQSHISVIQTFFDNFVRYAGQTFKVILIWGGQNQFVDVIEHGTLTEVENTVLDNAVWMLNDRIINLQENPATAGTQATLELEKSSQQLGKELFQQFLLKKKSGTKF